MHTVCKRRVLPAGRSGVCESRRRTSGSPLFSVCLPTSSPTSSPPSHPLLHVQTLPGSPTVGVIVKPGSTKRGSGSAAAAAAELPECPRKGVVHQGHRRQQDCSDHAAGEDKSAWISCSLSLTASNMGKVLCEVMFKYSNNLSNLTESL